MSAELAQEEDEEAVIHFDEAVVNADGLQGWSAWFRRALPGFLRERRPNVSGSSSSLGRALSESPLWLAQVDSSHHPVYLPFGMIRPAMIVRN